jgi:subtilase family serine protease
MNAHRVFPAFVSVLALVGCASTGADLFPVPATDGAIAVQDDGTAKLQVQVQNQGTLPAEASPVTVRFFLSKVTLTSVIQDGGPLQPGESSKVLEFQIPQDCVDGGCGFQVAVDPDKEVKDTNRANNLASGQCEGRVASTYAPRLGTPNPGVQ